MIRPASLLLLGLALPLAADWPKFRGPNGDNSVPDAEIVRSFPDSGPKRLWSIEVSEGYGGSAIVGEEVFAMDRVDQERDVLLCLDLASGEEKWRWEHEVPGRIPHPGSRTVPTVESDAIFTSGGFGHVYCIDRNTHEPRWIVDVAKVFSTQPPRFGYSIHPVVLEDKVIVAPTGDEVGLAALDRTSGEVLWKSDPVGESHSSPVLVELLGRKMLVMPGSRDRRLMVSGFDPETGERLFQYTDPHELGRHLAIPNLSVVDEDSAFFTGGYGQTTQLLHFAAGDDGIAVTKEHEIGAGAALHPVLIVGEHGYLSAGTTGGRRRGRANDEVPPGAAGSQALVCMDLEGKPLWNSGVALGEGSIIRVGDLIVSQDGNDGSLRLIEPGDEYRELAKGKVFTREPGQELWSPLAYSDGFLLMRSQNELACVDLRP